MTYPSNECARDCRQIDAAQKQRSRYSVMLAHAIIQRERFAATALSFKSAKYTRFAFTA